MTREIRFRWRLSWQTTFISTTTLDRFGDFSHRRYWCPNLSLRWVLLEHPGFSQNPSRMKMMKCRQLPRTLPCWTCRKLLFGAFWKKWAQVLKLYGWFALGPKSGGCFFSPRDDCLVLTTSSLETDSEIPNLSRKNAQLSKLCFRRFLACWDPLTKRLRLWTLNTARPRKTFPPCWVLPRNFRRTWT